MLLALSMPVLSLAQSDPDSAWAPEVPWEPIPSVESMGEIRPLFFEATGKNLGNRLMGGWFETPTGPERTVAFWNEDTWYPWGGRCRWHASKRSPPIGVSSMSAVGGTLLG